MQDGVREPPGRHGERTGQSTGELVRQAMTLYLAFSPPRVSNEQQNLRMLLDELLRQVAARDD